MTTFKDALFWHYDRHPLDGLVSIAARPNVALTDVGGGNSELAISMPLAAGNTWVSNAAAVFCPAASTVTQKRDCMDPLIKADLKAIWNDYQAFLAAPLPAPPNI